jgi:hypothetical protein
MGYECNPGEPIDKSMVEKYIRKAKKGDDRFAMKSGGMAYFEKVRKCDLEMF